MRNWRQNIGAGIGQELTENYGVADGANCNSN
jgi:hypothetical protein